MKILITIVLILSLGIQCLGQNLPTEDSISFINSYSSALQQIETISYSGLSERSKALSTDTTRSRFNIFARKNPNNIVYTYDWEIQVLGKGYLYHLIYIENDFYTIYSKDQMHKIGVWQNIFKLEEGSYREVMRSSFLPDEFIYDLPFNPTLVNHLSKIDGHFVIETRDPAYPDFFDRKFYNDITYLFTKKEDIGIYPDLDDAKSFTNITLSNYKINQVLPDSVLSPGFYLDQGFEVSLPDLKSENKTENKKENLETNIKNNTFSLLNTELVSSKGKKSTLQEHMDSNYLLLDFWFSSCSPCLKNLPRVQKLHDRYMDNGLKVIGVNCYDKKELEMILQNLKNKGISFPTLFGERSYLEDWGLRSFPSYVLLGKDGELIYSADSTLDEIEDYLEKQLD